MPKKTFYLNEEELAWVGSKGPGYIRGLVLRDMGLVGETKDVIETPREEETFYVPEKVVAVKEPLNETEYKTYTPEVTLKASTVSADEEYVGCPVCGFPRKKGSECEFCLRRKLRTKGNPNACKKCGIIKVEGKCKACNKKP